MRAPSFRRIEPCRHPRRHSATGRRARRRRRASAVRPAWLAQRPDRRPHPRQRRTASCRLPLVPRCGGGDRAARAAASRCRSCASRVTTASPWSSKATWTTSPRAPREYCAGVASAPVPVKASRALAELLGIPETSVRSRRGAQTIVPLRLAGSMALGARTPISADLCSMARPTGAAVKLSARLDGSDSGWRKGAVDVTGRVEGADGNAIAALLTPGGSSCEGPRTRTAASSRPEAFPPKGWPRSPRRCRRFRHCASAASSLPAKRQLGRRRAGGKGRAMLHGLRRSRDWRQPSASTALPIAGIPEIHRGRPQAGRSKAVASSLGPAALRETSRSSDAEGDRRRVEAPLISVSSTSPGCSAPCSTVGWQQSVSPRLRSRARAAHGLTSPSTAPRLNRFEGSCPPQEQAAFAGRRHRLSQAASTSRSRPAKST